MCRPRSPHNLRRPYLPPVRSLTGTLSGRRPAAEKSAGRILFRPPVPLRPNRCGPNRCGPSPCSLYSPFNPFSPCVPNLSRPRAMRLPRKRGGERKSGKIPPGPASWIFFPPPIPIFTDCRRRKNALLPARIPNGGCSVPAPPRRTIFRPPRRGGDFPGARSARRR